MAHKLGKINDKILEAALTLALLKKSFCCCQITKTFPPLCIFAPPYHSMLYFVHVKSHNYQWRAYFNGNANTPRPHAALLMCLKKYSADIGNSATGNYVVLCSKLILKTVLLEVSYGKND